MGESFLYTWEDVDAPVLLPNSGSFIDLLQAVLVDGYGDKPGLGWTSYFTGTNKAVFQNEGTKMLVRFDHSQEAYRVYFRAYESMSDIDNGLFPCPAISKTDNYILLDDGTGHEANVCPWRILGDDKGVWILVSPGYVDDGGYNDTPSGCFKFYYIGDYIPFDHTNTQYNFCTCQGSAEGSLSADQWACSALYATVDHFWAMRDLSLAPGAVQLGMGSGSPYETAGLGHTPTICQVSSDIQLTSLPTLHSSTAVLGRLPGLKNSLSKYGNNGADIANYAALVSAKPEMTFDHGDYKEHFWLNANADSPRYIALTEGKGFRNVL